MLKRKKKRKTGDKLNINKYYRKRKKRKENVKEIKEE